MINFNSFKIKKFIPILYNIYLLFMSIIIISIFLYFRLIIKRSAYSLALLKLFVDFDYFLLCFLILILHLFVLIFTISKLYFNTFNTNNKYLQYIAYIINIVFWKPLYFLLEKISPHIPYSGTIIINYCYFFRKSEFRLFLMQLVCFIFYFLPKIIMSILFFIEITFYNQLKYFILYFWVLLLPIIYIVFINLSEYFYTNNMPDVEKGLIVAPKGMPNSNGVYIEYSYSIRQNSGYSKDNLQELIDYWDLLFYLLNLNSIIRVFMQQCIPYINLFCSSLYLMALSYKIFYLFYL